MLGSADLVRPKPLQGWTVYAVTYMYALQEYFVVDRVECCRQIQKNQRSKISTVNGLYNLRQHK